MLNPTERWAAFKAGDERSDRELSFRDALSIFEALWAEAEALDADFTEPWLADFEADFRIARALNGLPPAT